MMTKMTLDEACDIITDFAVANSTDQLTGVELMVQHYSKLNRSERTAIITFMDGTKSTTLDKQKIL